LIDMGIEPFLLASSLEGVMTQRLVRTICPHCKAPDVPEPGVIERLGHRAEEARQGRFFRGKGCRHCRQTGYYGRSAIFELLRVTEPVRKAITSRAGAAQISAAAPQDHQPMIENGFAKAASGVTTLDEVLRVTQDARETGV
jgi:general secretion pathway protein E